MSTINRKAVRAKVHRRIRRKLSGTASRPRLAVYFSNRHVYAQIIDEHGRQDNLLRVHGRCLHRRPFQARQLRFRRQGGQPDRQRAKAANVTEVVFDRGGFKFCGKVKALADAARETGLKF